MALRFSSNTAQSSAPASSVNSAMSSSADLEQGNAIKPLLSASATADFQSNGNDSTLRYPPCPGLSKRQKSGEGLGIDVEAAVGFEGGGVRMAKSLFYLMVFAFSGPLLIMSNKNVLSNIGFAFPLTLSFLTLSFSWAVCWLSIKVGLVEFRQKKIVDRRFYITNILPIGALSAGTIVLGMASYLFLTVSFVQMIKAFTPVMTLVFMTSFGLTQPSRQTISCVLIICLGTCFAGLGEVNFSIVGMGCMLSAQMCEALKLVFIQVMLKNFKFNVVETLYYVTPISAAWVLIFASIIEFRHFDWNTWEMVVENKGAFIFSSLMAISTNAINAVVIQYTNALMLKLIATARNGALVLFNAMVLGEVVTPIQFCGYSVSLAGFLLYNALLRRIQDAGK